MGVEPVGSPSTVGTPAELFSRIRLSTTSATCRSTSAALRNISVGIRVCRTYCEELADLGRGGVRTLVMATKASLKSVQFAELRTLNRGLYCKSSRIFKLHS